MTMDSSSGLEVQVLSVSWFFSLDFLLISKYKINKIVYDTIYNCQMSVQIINKYYLSRILKEEW